MKATKVLLTISALLLLAGCTTPNQNKNNNNNQEDIDVDIKDDSRIDYISFPSNQRTIIMEVNKKEYLTIDFHANSNEYDNTVTWSSSDTSVVEVSQYGVVTSKKEGKASITCTTKEGNRSAHNVIYVVEDKSNISFNYQRVDDIYTLEAGDTIVFGCPEENKVASEELLSGALVGIDATYTSDKKAITSFSENTNEFMLDGETYNYTLETKSGQYLAAKNLKKIAYINKGNTHWAFSYDDGLMYIESTSNVAGWMMYDVRKNGFTLYDSNVIDHAMYMVTIYKKVLSLN